MAEFQYRNLNCFGVSGLVEEDAEVLYSSLFSPKNVGRISDLIAARFRSTGVDEVSLRAATDLLVFAAYAGQVPSDEDLFVVEKPLPAPLMVEAGMDSQKICVGVNFGGIKGEDLMQRLIERVRRCAQEVVVRSKGSDRREVIAVFSYPYAWKSQMTFEAPVVEVDLNAKEEEAPSVSSYLQLADLDYHQILDDGLNLEKQNAVPEGEFIARAGGQLPGHRGEEQAIIKGSGRATEEVAVIERSKKKGIRGFFQRLLGVGRDVGSDTSTTVIADTSTPENLASDPEVIPNLERILNESKAVAKDVKTDRSRRWVENLVADLAAEKTRIQDQFRKTNLQFRQKEMELLNRERMLTEDLRRKEDQLKQKQGALQVAKDQATRLQAELDAARAAKPTGIDLQMKKQIEYLKAQSEKQRLELDDSRKRLAEARSAAQVEKARGDTSGTKERLEKVQRQNEDFRRQNSQLISRINELEKRSGNAGSRFDEMKAKMDQAAGVIQERRQEIESLKKSLGDRDIVEIRLKRKIAELESKLQISKASAAGGSGGGKAA